jgi:hypothetical protein
MVTLPSVQSASPLQPVKVEPGSGVAVRVTTVPLPKLAAQAVPQLIPPGPVTVPEPVPALVTVRGYEIGVDVKVAVTDFAAFRVTVQEPVPVQSPDQPVKVEPAFAAAVRVITSPTE